MDFKASPAQRRLLDYIHANPSPLPTLGFCKSANVSRASFYRWCRDPNFRAWLGIAWTSRLLLDGISLMNQARAQAPDKFSYWRALSDLTFDPKGLGALVKWRESLVHLPPDAFLPGPDVKPKPKPKPPAGPRPQPDWVAELYKDSEFPPPAPPEISPEGFPIFHPESVEEWNRRHGFVDEPPDDPKVFSVAQPGHKGPRRSGLEVLGERAAGRSPAGRPRSINVNPVRTVLLLQRALNPAYPLRRPRRASAAAKPRPRVNRPSGRDLYREWVAWRRGLQRRPTRAGGAGASGACSRLRNETVKRSGNQHITYRAGENGTPAKSAPAQQARAFPASQTPGQWKRRGLSTLSRTVSPRNQANAALPNRACSPSAASSDFRPRPIANS